MGVTGLMSIENCQVACANYLYAGVEYADEVGANLLPLYRVLTSSSVIVPTLSSLLQLLLQMVAVTWPALVRKFFLFTLQ